MYKFHCETCIQVTCNLYTSKLVYKLQLDRVVCFHTTRTCPIWILRIPMYGLTTRLSCTFLYNSKTCQKLVSCIQLTTKDVRKMYGRCTWNLYNNVPGYIRKKSKLRKRIFSIFIPGWIIYKCRTYGYCDSFEWLSAVVRLLQAVGMFGAILGPDGHVQ